MSRQFIQKENFAHHKNFFPSETISEEGFVRIVRN